MSLAAAVCLQATTAFRADGLTANTSPKAHAPLAVPYMQQTCDSCVGVAQILHSVSAHCPIPQLRLLGGLHRVAVPCTARCSCLTSASAEHMPMMSA